MTKVRLARFGDAAHLAPRLREADLQEIKANLGEDPPTVLARGIAESDPCYAVLNGEDIPIALFGVVSIQATPRSDLFGFLLLTNWRSIHSLSFVTAASGSSYCSTGIEYFGITLMLGTYSIFDG